MTDKKPKVKDNETMDEKNVERFIQSAINKYFDKHMMLDAMFWREAVQLYGKKREEQGKLATFESIWKQWESFKSDYVAGSSMPYVMFERWLKSQLKEEEAKK